MIVARHGTLTFRCGRRRRPGVRCGRAARRRARAQARGDGACDATSSLRSPRGFENQADRLRQAKPAGLLVFQLASTLGREAIELRLATRVRQLPVSGQQPAVLEPVQGGIERTLRYLDHVARDQLEALRDAVAVDGAGGDDVKDQQVEGALGEIGPLRHHTPPSSTYTAATCKSARRITDWGEPDGVGASP